MRNDVFNNRRYVPVIRYNDPALQAAMLNNQGDYARIFVMINNVFIGHSGLVLDEGEYSFCMIRLVVIQGVKIINVRFGKKFQRVW